MKLMYKFNISNGLFPTQWNIENGNPNNGRLIPLSSHKLVAEIFSAHYSVGAYADSAHEYLLKQYLLTARSEPQTLELCTLALAPFSFRFSLASPDLSSINGVINNLLYLTPNRHLLYVTDTTSGITTHKLEHLSCFFPGLLALGLFSLSATDTTAYTSAQKQLHYWAAEGLAETCWLIYHDQKSGLGPDEVWMEDYMKTQGGNDRGNVTRGTNFVSVADTEKDGLWVRQVAKWKKDRKKSGTPPGVPASGESFKREEDSKKRDYRVMISSYLLRPEVCSITWFLSVRGTTDWCG